jgi:hypothetical protein
VLFVCTFKHIRARPPWRLPLLQPRDTRECVSDVLRLILSGNTNTCDQCDGQRETFHGTGFLSVFVRETSLCSIQSFVEHKLDKTFGSELTCWVQQIEPYPKFADPSEVSL